MTELHDAAGIRPFLGQWQNTANETLWLQGFRLAEKDGQFTIKPKGISAPFDWGEHAVECFRFHGNEASFYCSFSLAQMTVDLMAYTNKGLIVIATHLAFEDASGCNHLSREFFVPIESAAENQKPKTMSTAQAINHRRLPLIKDGGDLTDLLGTWVNANDKSESLSRLIIERDEQQEYWIRTFAVADPVPVNWGRVAMDVHQAGRRQSGFHATYDLAETVVHLVANYKLGVLVIELFSSFKGSGDRPGTIGREFFRRASKHTTMAATAEALPDDSVPVDLTPFAGSWINSSDSGQWLEQFTLSADRQGWQLQIRTGDIKPDPVPVTSYMDNMGYLAFKACIELSDRHLIIAANTQKALVVMTSYERFLPCSVQATAQNRVYREIFIHDTDDTMAIAECSGLSA